jgi:hypothetical protein
MNAISLFVAFLLIIGLIIMFNSVEHSPLSYRYNNILKYLRYENIFVGLRIQYVWNNTQHTKDSSATFFSLLSYAFLLAPYISFRIVISHTLDNVHPLTLWPDCLIAKSSNLPYPNIKLQSLPVF